MILSYSDSGSAWTLDSGSFSYNDSFLPSYVDRGQWLLSLSAILLIRGAISQSAYPAGVCLCCWLLTKLLGYCFHSKPSPSSSDLYTNRWLCYLAKQKKTRDNLLLWVLQGISVWFHLRLILLVIVLVCCLVGQKGLFSYFCSESPLLSFCWAYSFTSWDGSACGGKRWIVRATLWDAWSSVSQEC